MKGALAHTQLTCNGVTRQSDDRRFRKRQHRKRFVAMVTKVACAVALLLIMYLLLSSGFRFIRQQLSASKVGDSSKRKEFNGQVVVVHNTEEHTAKFAHRFKRSAPRETTYITPGGVTVNELLPADTWKELEMAGVIPLDENLNPATEARETIPTVTTHKNYSNEYERVAAFCQATIANKTKSTNGSEAATEGHGEAGESSEHDVCATQRNSGLPALWAILYILIVLFLFIALAIICDDFFVPSLEVISERLNLSEDVAGATFMAAGSSAPELFTSVAGVGTGSDVGVGTIVGSAVFNLLVIIALTSALAGRVLQIDWRPLARDSIFYGGSVLVFILFSWDGIFMWWESFFLLLLYVLYIVTMKFNQKLMAFLGSLTCCGCSPQVDGRVSPTLEGGEDQGDVTPAEPSFSGTNGIAANTTRIKETVAKQKVADATISSPTNSGCQCCCCCCCRRACGCRFTATDVTTGPPSSRGDVMAGNGKLTMTSSSPEQYDVAASSAVADEKDSILCQDCKEAEYLQGELAEIGEGGTKVKDSLEKPDHSDSGFSSVSRIDSKEGPPPYECVRFSTDDDGKENRCARSDGRRLTIASQRPSEIHIFRRSSRKSWSSTRKSSSSISIAAGENGLLRRSESTKVDEYVFTEPESPPHNLAPPGTSGANGSREDPEAAAAAMSAEGNSNEEEEEAEQTLMVFPCLPPIKHAPPVKPDSSHCIPSAKYLWAWFVYLLSFPWLCAYTWTIPDCSKEENKKYYVMSFLISIMWIALISYVMVEVVDVIGCLMGIDSYTMGLVVIAVGTSVPDALSSVLVAREGFGDMAVSNAIGSNVFDINLGLGLPFLIRSMITAEPVYLLSPLQGCLMENLTLAVRIVPHVKFGIILLLILFVCLVLFVLVRFRLNKTIGIIFVTIYVAFMIYAFVQEKSCYAFYC